MSGRKIDAIENTLAKRTYIFHASIQNRREKTIQNINFKSMLLPLMPKHISSLLLFLNLLLPGPRIQKKVQIVGKRKVSYPCRGSKQRAKHIVESMIYYVRMLNLLR